MRRPLAKAASPKNKRVSKKISALMDEGHDQKQAVAMALDMEREGRLTDEGDYVPVEKGMFIIDVGRLEDLAKGRVRTHTRRTASGKVVQVREHNRGGEGRSKPRARRRRRGTTDGAEPVKLSENMKRELWSRAGVLPPKLPNKRTLAALDRRGMIDYTAHGKPLTAKAREWLARNPGPSTGEGLSDRAPRARGRSRSRTPETTKQGHDHDHRHVTTRLYFSGPRRGHPNDVVDAHARILQAAMYADHGKVDDTAMWLREAKIHLSMHREGVGRRLAKKFGYDRWLKQIERRLREIGGKEWPLTIGDPGYQLMQMRQIDPSLPPDQRSSTARRMTLYLSHDELKWVARQLGVWSSKVSERELRTKVGERVAGIS